MWSRKAWRISGALYIIFLVSKQFLLACREFGLDFRFLE